MKNRDKQRANRRKKPKTGEISYHNHEHYADPTAYQAMKNIERNAQRDKPER